MTHRPRGIAGVLVVVLASSPPLQAFVQVMRSDPAPQPVVRPAPGALDDGGGTERPEPRMVLDREEPITLAANRATVAIRDQIAVVRLVQIFQNNTDGILQARYTLPLGPDAHVSSYAIWEKGDKLVGELMEVRRAERLYRQVTRQELTEQPKVAQTARAVRVVRDPGILRQMAPDRFDTHLYPLWPYALKQMEVLYAQAVTAEGGWCEWRFPIDAAKVFANGIGEASFEIELADTAGVREVACDRPDARITREGDGFRISFTSRNFAPPGPFVLRWRTGLEPLVPRVLAHRSGDDDGYALLRVAVPGPAEAGPGDAGQVLDVILAIDRSGSYRPGAKADARRKAVEHLARALRPDDRLGAVLFGGEGIRVEPLRTAGDAPAKVAGWLADPGGGRTELAPALRAAFAAAGPPEPGRARLVVLASDGVTEEDPEEVVAAATPTGARLLSIGGGHDDDVDLLLTLGERHGGALWIARGGERPLYWAERSPGMLREPYGSALVSGEAEDPSPLLDRFRRPALAGLRIADPSGALYAIRPLHVETSFAGGSTASFLFRYPRGGACEIEMTGVLDGRPFARRMPLDLPDAEEHHRFVASFWARAETQNLLRRHPTGDDDPNRARIVELALKHRFVTPYTAFLSLPDAERKRYHLGPAPPDDGGGLYTFAGAVPEAETWALILVGLAVTGLAGLRRRRAEEGGAA